MEESTVDLQLPALHMHTPLSCGTDACLPVPKSFQIFVKNPTGKTLLIDVYGTDTIEIVKFLVQNLEGIPPGEHFKTGSEHNH